LLAVLDTTVFVDASGGDHDLRHASRHVLDAVLNGDLQASISVETVQEAFHLTLRRTGDRGRAIALARWLTSSYDVIETDRALMLDALERLQEFDAIGGIDAVILAGTHRIGADALVTRDKRLGKAAGALWVDSSDAQALSGFLRNDQ
jgi:predicted nucleic acid-binding protein